MIFGAMHTETIHAVAQGVCLLYLFGLLAVDICITLEKCVLMQGFTNCKQYFVHNQILYNRTCMSKVAFPTSSFRRVCGNTLLRTV